MAEPPRVKDAAKLSTGSVHSGLGLSACATGIDSYEPLARTRGLLRCSGRLIPPSRPDVSLPLLYPTTSNIGKKGDEKGHGFAAVELDTMTPKYMLKPREIRSV